MGAEPDVDGQHPELLQDLQQSGLGGQGKGNGEEIDPRAAGEVDELGDGPELAVGTDGRRRAAVVTIVEDADDVDIASIGGFQCLDQAPGRLATADQDATARQLPLSLEPAEEGGGNKTVEHGCRDGAQQP